MRELDLSLFLSNEAEQPLYTYVCANSTEYRLGLRREHCLHISKQGGQDNARHGSLHRHHSPLAFWTRISYISG